MLEDIHKYSFDFETEAADVAIDLVARGHAVAIAEIDVTTTTARKTPDIAFYNAVTSWLPGAKLPGSERKRITDYYQKNPEESSAWLGIKEGNNLIALRRNEILTISLGEENTSIMRLFVLYHEAGHVLSHDGPEVDQDHAYNECVADAYAALRLFQRFGKAGTAEFLSMVSWRRAADAMLARDTTHLTTMVLDKIVADSRTYDFSALTPTQAIGLAEHYTKDWMPRPVMLSALREVYDPVKSNRLDLLHRTCLSTSNNFAFYIGAKFFQPYLTPGGVLQDGKDNIRYDERTRLALSAPIIRRARLMKLKDIFEDAAKKATFEPKAKVETLLKVSDLRHGRQLEYRTKLP